MLQLILFIFGEKKKKYTNLWISTGFVYFQFFKSRTFIVSCFKFFIIKKKKFFLFQKELINFLYHKLLKLILL